MRNAPAYVYWFRLVIGRRIVGHKIGWAFEWKQRLQGFNSVALAALGGLHYRVQAYQHFSTARIAYGIEQRILRDVDHLRHPANREVLTGIRLPVLSEIWNTNVVAALLGKAST